MNKSNVLWSLLLTLLPALVQAQQRYELTVKEAVEMAFKNVANVKNAQLDYQLQEAKNKEILGQALPQLSGSAQAAHYLKLPALLFPDASQTGVYAVLVKEGVLPAGTPVPAPVMRQVSFQQPWNLTLGATLNQLLFQPDVFVGLQARKTSLDYYNALLEQTKEAVKDSAYKRYYAILIAQKQLHFLNEAVARLEKLYRDDSIMYKNGFAERLDLERVQVQLTNLITNRNVVESSVELAKAGLKYAIGAAQTDTVVLKEELTVEGLKEGILDNGFRYEDRAEIRTLEQTRKLQQLDLKRHKLGYIPTISASGSYGVNALGQKFFTDPNTIWINSAFVGLNVNIPLFDGFQRKYRVQQSRITLEKLENSIENVKEVIDLQQVITKESLKNALLNVDAQERNLALAEKVYNTTKLKFEQGLGSSFEVLQADSDWQTAQSNFFNALYNATVARISYLSALGKLQ